MILRAGLCGSPVNSVRTNSEREVRRQVFFLRCGLVALFLLAQALAFGLAKPRGLCRYKSQLLTKDKPHV